MSDLLTGLLQESVSGIALGCIYALIALGFTLIYKATEVVNFAQGEIMMVGAYINFFFVTQFSAMAGGLTGWVFIAALFCSIIFAVQPYHERRISSGSRPSAAQCSSRIALRSRISSIEPNEFQVSANSAQTRSISLLCAARVSRGRGFCTGPGRTYAPSSRK